MDRDRFVYVTYIRTTPDKLWAALTEPEFTRAYWFGCRLESGWTPGSDWRIILPDGRIADSGEVVEAEKPRRLVVKWRHELMPDLHAEGFSRCTFEIEPIGTSVKLVVTHEIDVAGSKLIQAVSGGWPQILSSLKSLLETGEALEGGARMPEKG